MNSNDLKLYLEWDYYAWGEALKYWDSILPSDLSGKKVLELGGRHGGLSLFFARKGATVICSDLHGPSVDAKNLHKNFPNISHEAIDATNIPYEDEFDYIVFKSVLGGVGYDGNTENQVRCLHSINKSLKENGLLLFCENSKASPIHRLARKLKVKWANRWGYTSTTELNKLITKSGMHPKINSFGFFSLFTRNNKIKLILYKLDKCINRLIPNSFKYINYGHARK